MVRQTGGGRRTDTADRITGAGRGGGAAGRGGNNMARKAVFRPTVRAPPIGATPTLGNSSEAGDTARVGNPGRAQGGGLLLVNRKPAGAAITGASTDTSSEAATGPHTIAGSPAKGGAKLVVENPWAMRSQRQEAMKPMTRPTAAMPNGRRHPIGTLSNAGHLDDYDESRENWDEMLDKGFDYSQDIEFGDGTAVRINTRTRSKLPPPTKPATEPPPPPPPPAEATPAQPTRPANGAIPIEPPTPVEPPTPTEPPRPAVEPPSPAVEPPIPVVQPELAGTSAAELPLTTPRAVETSWGKPAKAAAGTSAEGAAAPASRWWKASLSNSTVRPPPPQQQPQIPAQAVDSRVNSSAPARGTARVDPSDSSSQRGGRGERGSRAGRGSRRSLAPIPTVVPPVLLRRPTQQPPALDAPCPEPAAVEPLPPLPLSAEEPKAKDKGGDIIQSKGAAPKQAPVAESGSSSPRNAKKATEPGPRKPNAAGSEPSRLAENWRAGPAPKPPPAPQPAALAQATVPSEPAVPANAPRRRSTGAAAKAPAQQDKPERPAPKPSAAATATSWRAEPSRTKPAVEAAKASEEDAGSKRALTQDDAPPNGRAAYPAGSSASQINGVLHVMPLSPALLPQTMLAELLDEGASQAPIRDVLPVMPEAAAPAQGRFGVSSSSLFNVEGSPLMGSYNAPVRPAFGHADPGLFSWQGSHMGFHDMRARQEYLHASSAAAEPRWASSELSQGAPFSSFSAAAALWMDPAHEGRAVESQDSGSACGSGASSGSRGHRAPRPIGTRSSGPGNGQRNTRSRQGMQYGAPSPVPGQHPLFVPATHMHQSWLPHYSAMQPAYAAGGARFGGGVSPRHSPQMTAAPQPPAVGPPFVVAHSMDHHHQQMLQMPAHQMQQGGRANGAFASAPPQYMPEAFRPSPPMYQYGYVGGAQPPPKQGKAGPPPPPTTTMAPHYHGYPTPQMPMPSHTGSAPHMAFMPMYIPGDPNTNAYYYGQAFGGPPPLGQYRPMPGYPSASMETQKPVAEPLAAKQAEKLLGISRSSSNSTRGPSKPAEPLAAPAEAAVPRTTTSMAPPLPPHPPHPQAKGERTRQRGSGRRNERKPAKENAEVPALPRERPQRSDAKRGTQQQQQQQQPAVPKSDAKAAVPKPDDKARKQPVPLLRTANASAPGEDGKAAAGDHGPGGEKPARRNRGNRPGRGGAKKGSVPAAGAKVG